MLFSAPMVIWGTLLQRGSRRTCWVGSPRSTSSSRSALMPVSMALAGRSPRRSGCRTTFLIAGRHAVVFAVVAIVWAKLPADELAHPLD